MYSYINIKGSEFDLNNSNILYNIFPELLHIIDRTANNSWKLDDRMEFYNIILVYAGKAEYTCNGKKILASEGDFIFFKPGDVRTATTFSDNFLKCYAVDFKFTCPVYNNSTWELASPELPFSFYQRIEDKYLFSRLSDLFIKLTHSALSNSIVGKVRERTTFIDILTLLLQYSDGNQYNYSNIRKVDKIIDYMTENYNRNITLLELSKHFQISGSYLGNIFKKVTGKSTIEYLISIRINKAKSLLKDGLTVSETSKLVGFNDIFYFSKAFKKHEGMSPTQFINLEKGEI